MSYLDIPKEIRKNFYSNPVKFSEICRQDYQDSRSEYELFKIRYMTQKFMPGSLNCLGNHFLMKESVCFIHNIPYKFFCDRDVYIMAEGLCKNKDYQVTLIDITIKRINIKEDRLYKKVKDNKKTVRNKPLELINYIYRICKMCINHGIPLRYIDRVEITNIGYTCYSLNIIEDFYKTSIREFERPNFYTRYFKTVEKACFSG